MDSLATRIQNDVSQSGPKKPIEEIDVRIELLDSIHEAIHREKLEEANTALSKLVIHLGLESKVDFEVE